MKKTVLVIAIIALVITGLLAATLNSDTTVAKALAKKASIEALEAEAKDVGLTCPFSWTYYSCKKMISRAEKNPRLKEAFLNAQAKGVTVWPGMWPWFSAGSVGTGLVDVNTLASDEKIIAFLTK